MVFLDLKVEFDCEKIKKLFVDSDFVWRFIVKCSNCNEEHPNEICFQEDDEVEGPKSVSVCNFSMKCKECNREKTITFLKASKREIITKNGTKGSGILATFDCRGLELVQWIPKEGVKAIAEETETVFTDVDLSDLWVEYDEKAQDNCQIDGMKHEFIRSKGI